jgi:hypothetical protein
MTRAHLMPLYSLDDAGIWSTDAPCINSVRFRVRWLSPGIWINYDYQRRGPR